MTFPRMVNEYYRDQFDDTPMMVNDLYLTVVYNPVGMPLKDAGKV